MQLSEEALRQIQETCVTCTLNLSAIRTSKALNPEQQRHIAGAFEAGDGEIRSSKKLFARNDPRIKKIKSILGQARSTWLAWTVPTIQDGVRLLRTQRVRTLCEDMEVLKASLHDAAQELDDAMPQIIEERRKDKALGSAFDPSDYDFRAVDVLRISYDIRQCASVPSNLATLAPEIVEEEKRKILAELQGAADRVAMEFGQRFAEFVSEFRGRITEGKRIRQDTIDGINELVGKFRELDFGASPSVAACADKIKEALSGVEAKSVRTSQQVRDNVVASMDGIMSYMQEHGIERAPRRKIKPMIDTPNESEEE